MKLKSLILFLFISQSCALLDGIKTREDLAKNKNQNLQEIQVNSDAELEREFDDEDNDVDQKYSRSSKLEITEIEKSDLKDDEIENEVKDEIKTKKAATKVVNRESQLFTETLDLRYSPKLFNWWINFFTKREKARFNRHLNNGIKYKALIKSIFKEHGLPSDLYYVGLIESGFNTYIKSRAGAKGPWQFMRGTAKNYGLRVDGHVDERANLVKATHAAARYFKDLYNIFNSWELALCAYNAGEYRIVGAIRRGNTRDYRELVAKKLLPKETIYYIPKVAAAKTIIDRPEKFGFKVKYNQVNPYENHVLKKVPYSFNQRKLAKVLGISYEKFREVNPEFRTADVRVYSKRRGVDILVPETTKTNLAASEIKDDYRVTVKTTTGKYRVKRGDNLSSIARRLGMRLSDLKRINGIRGSKILVGQRLKTTSTKVVKKSSSKPKNKRVVAKSVAPIKSKKPIRHTVRRGENLTLIARLYGTSVRAIKLENSLRRSKIFVGQRLRVPSSNHSFYTVRRGDNLSKIAAKFGLKISSIKRANNLRGSRIYVGQRVVIPSNG